MNGKVNLTINGRSFPINCNPGEEDRIRDLGNYIDEKARELTKSFSGKINDLHLMVMVSLLLADELRDALTENQHLEESLDQQERKVEDPRLSDPTFMKAVELLASRMENLAEKAQTS